MPPEEYISVRAASRLKTVAFTRMCRLFDAPHYIRNINVLEPRLLESVLGQCALVTDVIFQQEAPNVSPFDHSYYIEEACDYVLSEWITTTQFNTLQIIGDITV